MCSGVVTVGVVIRLSGGCSGEWIVIGESVMAKS